MAKPNPRSKSTLPPPPAPMSKVAPIENLLRLHRLTDVAPHLFTNAVPLWQPPGARGLYGGASIAQSLSAAYLTVPPDFIAHNMHCYFLLAGESEIPIVYEVNHVSDGRSFATRAVQAKQRDRYICKAMISFTKQRPSNSSNKTIEHQPSMPTDVELPSEAMDRDGTEQPADTKDSGKRSIRPTPFQTVVCPTPADQSRSPEEKKFRHWTRARGRIGELPTAVSSNETEAKIDNRSAHLAALAYISDSLFIGTVPRAHGLFHIPYRNTATSTPTTNTTTDSTSGPSSASSTPASQSPPDLPSQPQPQPQNQRKQFASQDLWSQPQLGMMVSLDHCIYFHNPSDFCADEWMLCEMTSPWAGDGRGFVCQKIWSATGKLIATCTQEGVVRLKQPGVDGAERENGKEKKKTKKKERENKL